MITAITNGAQFVFQSTANFAKSYVLFKLWEAAVSQTLVCDTLRHGTSFKGWWGIMLHGADRTKGVQNVTLGHFYLWRDTRRFSMFQKTTNRLMHVSKSARDLVRTVGPLTYATGGNEVVLSALNFSPLFQSIAVPLLSRLTILKFHLRPDERSHRWYRKGNEKSKANKHSGQSQHQDYVGFEWNDRIAPYTIYTNLTSKTQTGKLRELSCWNIGICGALKNGLNLGLVTRVIYNPLRFVKGIFAGGIALHLTAELFKLHSPITQLLASPQAAHLVLQFPLAGRVLELVSASWNYRAVQAVAYAVLWKMAL